MFCSIDLGADDVSEWTPFARAYIESNINAGPACDVYVYDVCRRQEANSVTRIVRSENFDCDTVYQRVQADDMIRVCSIRHVVY